MKQEELEKILKKHVIWLETEGKEGKKADLSGEDLSGLNLGGTNLKGAILPEGFSDETLSRVEEVSKNARALFVWMILGCLYCWLAIGMTTDNQLISNSPTSKLPIIGTEIPIVGFYFAAPVFIIGIFFYFHLYIQRLWRFLSKLPAYFQDGKPIDDKVYPWLLNSLVWKHFELLKEKQPALCRFQANVSILITWWIVPVTIFAFWFSYLRRHDWVITSFHVVLLAITIFSAFEFYNLAKRTLRGQELRSIDYTKKDLIRLFKKIVRPTNLIPLVFFFLISVWLIEGNPHKELTWDLRTWRMPRILAKMNLRTFADLEDKEISEKSEKWTGKIEELETELNSMSVILLQNINLRHAKANRVFLVKADLREADLRHAELAGSFLQGAWLKKANLRYAVLSESFLQHAKLEGADLNNANLSKAKLQITNFLNAKLQETKLNEADLRYAVLTGTNLKKADLRGADLRNAILKEANLRKANFLGATFSKDTKLDGADLQGASFEFAKELVPAVLEGTRNKSLALYDPAFLRRYGHELNLPFEHNQNIRNKDLQGYILQGENLRGANLRNMNLSETDLREADLTGANLIGADFKEANLSWANFDGSIFSLTTNLASANLQGANFEFAQELVPAVLEGTRNRSLALYDRDFLVKYGNELKLPPDHNDNIENKNLTNYILQRADLRGADLRAMNLSNANLREADLTDASLQNAMLEDACLDETILEGADLENANLKGVKGLKEPQLQSAKNYEKAVHPDFPTKGCDDS